jgi:hypothetical protein
MVAGAWEITWPQFGRKHAVIDDELLSAAGASLEPIQPGLVPRVLDLRPDASQHHVQ